MEVVTVHFASNSAPQCVPCTLKNTIDKYLTTYFRITSFSVGFEWINHRDASRTLWRYYSEARCDTLSSLWLIKTTSKRPLLSDDLQHIVVNWATNFESRRREYVATTSKLQCHWTCLISNFVPYFRPVQGVLQGFSTCKCLTVINSTTTDLKINNEHAGFS